MLSIGRIRRKRNLLYFWQSMKFSMSLSLKRLPFFFNPHNYLQRQLGHARNSITFYWIIKSQIKYILAGIRTHHLTVVRRMRWQPRVPRMGYSKSVSAEISGINFVIIKYGCRTCRKMTLKWVFQVHISPYPAASRPQKNNTYKANKNVSQEKNDFWVSFLPTYLPTISLRGPLCKETKKTCFVLVAIVSLINLI
jgi:hypothetical protein